MRRSRSVVLRSIVAAAVVAAAAVRAAGQEIPVDFQIGYRFVDVTGNEQMYRTQINDRPGLLLQSLDYTSTGPVAGFLDYVHIDGSDIGAGPAGQFRFQAGRQDLFKLTFTWRQMDNYSALPAFANPFLAEGIIPGQQTWNRTRNIYDATLELLPGKSITPLLGYTRNTYAGPGTTTYHIGQNEFLLNDQVSSVDELFRVGVGFHVGDFQGAVTQGWRQFRWHEFVTLAPGAGAGNYTQPVLGQVVTAENITGDEKNKVNTPVTDVWLAANLFSRVKLTGSYVRADANAETGYAEADAGSFVSFEIARFFAGLSETINSQAHTDFWRGSVRADVSLAPNIDLTGGWVETSRNLEGEALISDLFLSTVTYAGVPVGDLLQLVDAQTSVRQTNQVYDANVTARMLGPFAVNAGWSQLHQNVDVTPDASEIVVPGGQGGEFERTVNTYGGGVSFAKWGVTATADYHHDEANQPIFRTDFIHRDRYKFRALWSCGNLFKIGGFFRETHADDDIVQIGYATRVREVGAEAEVNLFNNALTLSGSGGTFLVHREILIRVPQNFDIVQETQEEFGHTWQGGATLHLGAFSLQAAYLWMNNNGSIPFTFNRARATAEYFFLKDLGAYFEWMYDKYDERIAFDQAGPLANYNANRYTIGVHWRP